MPLLKFESITILLYPKIFSRYTKVMFQYLHVPRKQQFLKLNSYSVNTNTYGSNYHAIQFDKMTAVIGARQAREARVTAALMAATYLTINGTRVC